MQSPISNSTYHVPVLATESVNALAINPADCVFDLTCGGGGHSSLFAALLNCQGSIVLVDRDYNALAETYSKFCAQSSQILMELASAVDVNSHLNSEVTSIVAKGVLNNGASWQMIKSRFSDLANIVEVCGQPPNCVFADLGVSSAQLDQASRGFSYRFDAPLDMRMDAATGRTAAEILAVCYEAELVSWLYQYGEERYAKRIAHALCKRRTLEPIKTTGDLASIVIKAMPAASRREAKHPAKRTFQALRIVVNDELGQLEKLLEIVPLTIAPNGRLGILTFHSLEDRIVKEKYRFWERECICPPTLPICQCGKTALGVATPRRGIKATEAEQSNNRRAHSARLRTFIFGEVEKHGN